MLRYEDAGQDSLGVETDEHLDRPVIAPLERLQVGRPERVADHALRARPPATRERLEVRRVTLADGERRRGRKKLLELTLEPGIRSLTSDDGQSRERDDRNECSDPHELVTLPNLGIIPWA